MVDGNSVLPSLATAPCCTIKKSTDKGHGSQCGYLSTGLKPTVCEERQRNLGRVLNAAQEGDNAGGKLASGG